jgi:hypothetical protein
LLRMRNLRGADGARRHQVPRLVTTGLFPRFLEDNVDGVNDLLVGMLLAVQDHKVLTWLHPLDMGKVLLCQPVVPGCEHVGVFLERSCKLRASESLNVDKSVSIGIGRQTFGRPWQKGSPRLTRTS